MKTLKRLLLPAFTDILLWYAIVIQADASGVKFKEIEIEMMKETLMWDLPRDTESGRVLKPYTGTELDALFEKAKWYHDPRNRVE
ncbi:hypothetical protein BCR33DRAFT_716199 [Rhizoclosmatium globosum]|uniref:Uncharacterized protein n=1 Tax=Rhizoclosmatium globosum TaxID=329046 RepID=A0A1Y2CGR9_9FUNG|nr:hypothetical protein BCR33DRAFT_716199 [Rhizoclosmatium globosum]|eukprot:ORY45515.1 hypothetical protein BCR33DRAFT_716199 [Rhizoclosmatium globosum]